MQNDVLIKTVAVDIVLGEFGYYVSKGVISVDELVAMFVKLPEEAIKDIDTALAYALVHKERE